VTKTANARIAGAAYLLYIALGVPTLILMSRATRGEDITAKLATMALHGNEVRIAIILGLITCFLAITLAVTLHAMTREEDADLAQIAMACRIGEGILGGGFLFATLGLLWAATSNEPADRSSALPAFFFKVGDWSPLIAGTFFAVGSTVFCWLLLRGRTISIPLAWLGVIGSAILVIGLPLQLAGYLHGMVVSLLWIPVAIFELVLGPWWIIKGASRH
jgi:hypothetical protein